MEKLRIQKKNETRNEIRMLNKHIEVANNTILHRKKTLRSDDSFNMSEIEKLESRNKEREMELERMIQRLNDIESGSLDEQFQKEINANKEAEMAKAEVKRVRKIQLAENKKENSKQLQAFYKKGKGSE